LTKDGPLADFETAFLTRWGDIAGASEAVREMIDLGHKVWICTSPRSRSPYCVTEKHAWVENYFRSTFVGRLVVTKDKTLVRGRYLIDDQPEIRGTLNPEMGTRAV
jgi:5'(3')-deoxyribonucleotidase